MVRHRCSVFVVLILARAPLQLFTCRTQCYILIEHIVQVTGLTNAVRRKILPAESPKFGELPPTDGQLNAALFGQFGQARSFDDVSHGHFVSSVQKGAACHGKEHIIDTRETKTAIRLYDAIEKVTDPPAIYGADDERDFCVKFDATRFGRIDALSLPPTRRIRWRASAVKRSIEIVKAIKEDG